MDPDDKPKHQDPADPYRTDRQVETDEQEDAVDELKQTKKAERTDIMHGADLGVHSDLPEN